VVKIKARHTCGREPMECLGEPTISDGRCAGLPGIVGSDPLLLVAVDAEIGAVGGAEIFRPITGGAGRPMLRINVLI